MARGRARLVDRPAAYALRLVARALLFLLISLAFAEIALRVASTFTGDRAGSDWRPGATVRVLAVGDSHTHGLADPTQAYPVYLQHFLEEAAPGVYSVINLGVPSLNTAQVLKRLPVNLARWEPDILVVWCGVNNTWNIADMTGGDLTTLLDRAALRQPVNGRCVRGQHLRAGGIAPCAIDL